MTYRFTFILTGVFYANLLDSNMNAFDCGGNRIPVCLPSFVSAIPQTCSLE